MWLKNVRNAAETNPPSKPANDRDTHNDDVVVGGDKGKVGKKVTKGGGEGPVGNAYYAPPQTFQKKKDTKT